MDFNNVKSRKYSRAGSKASTMILRAVVCNTCTLYNQHSPYRSLLNALEKPTDLVRLIAHISDKGIHTILCNAVMLHCANDTYGPRMSNCWLPAATWVEAIRKSGHIDSSLTIDVQKFNTAVKFIRRTHDKI